MTNNYAIKEVDRDTWLRLVPEYKDYNYRQSWEFGIACAVRIGAVSEHVIIEHAEQGVVGLADVRIKKLPLVGGGIAYINGGPLVVKSCDLNENVFLEVVTVLQNEYVVKRKLSLRIAPPFLDDTHKNAVEIIFSNLGFNNIGQRKKTIILDLSLDLAIIRQSLHQKWRNALNNVEKKNLDLRVGKNMLLFGQFIPLFNDLIRKKSFSIDLGIDFYANVQNQSDDADKFLVTLAEADGVPIAGHVASILGDTCVYLLGATNDDGRKLNAAYLLQWEVIKRAKSLGCRWYDLGGINQTENPGVYRFKQRMGGIEVDIPGPYEKSASGVKTLLTKLGEKAYGLLKPYLIHS